jgi:hypothetical protein
LLQPIDVHVAGAVGSGDSGACDDDQRSQRQCEFTHVDISMMEFGRHLLGRGASDLSGCVHVDLLSWRASL